MPPDDRWPGGHLTLFGAVVPSDESAKIDFRSVEDAWSMAQESLEEIGLSRARFHYSNSGWSRRFLAEWDAPEDEDAWHWTTTVPVVVDGKAVGVFEFRGDPRTTPLEACSGLLADLLARFEKALSTGQNSSDQAA